MMTITKLMMMTMMMRLLLLLDDDSDAADAADASNIQPAIMVFFRCCEILLEFKTILLESPNLLKCVRILLESKMLLNLC